MTHSQSIFTETQKELAYKAGFQNNSETIFIIDREWNVVHANSTFAERFGKKLEECIGINVYDLLSPDAYLERIRYAEKAFLTGKRQLFEDYSNGRYLRHSIYPVAGNDETVEFLYIIVQDITETKLTDPEIKRVIAISQEAIEAFPGPFTVIDVNGKIVSCNSHFHHIIASEANQNLSGLNTFDLFHPDDQSLLFEKLQNIIQNGVQETADLRVRLNGGTEYGWFRITTKRFIVNNEIFLVSSGTDIEKYKNTEKQLSFSNEQLRFILSESRTGSWEWDLKSNINTWSDEIWELYGLEPHSFEPSYEKWKNTIIEADRDNVLNEVFEASKKGAPLRIEWRVRLADGSLRWLMSRGIPFRDANGDVSRYVGIVIDISDLKESERNLKESEERFRNFFEQHSAFMMIIDPGTGRIVDVNASAAEFYGWRRTRLLQMNMMDLNIDASDASFNHLEEWKSADKRTFIVTHRKADGTSCTIEVFGKKIHVRNRPFAFLILHDITERKRFQQALVERNNQMHFILNTTNAGTWETSLETRESKWSDEIWSLFGIEPGSCSPSLENWLNTIIPEDRPAVEHALAMSVQTLSEFNANWRVQDADGNIRWLLCKGSPVKNSDGKVTKYVGMTLDITEKKRTEDEKMQLESRIRRSERLETLGNLAGGIAHDFNNMLTPILGYAEMGMIELPQHDNVYAYLHEITRAADRAKNLVHQILTFSKTQETESSAVSVQSIIEEALTLLRASIPTTISIEKHIDRTCRNIFADPSKIYQVILNLCTNAFQAMEESGGTLTIKLEETIPDDALIRAFPELHEKPYVLLTISDTGYGMNSKTLDRLFEPFFTTKPVNKGTGLGLSVVHGIITSYNGVINIESEPGAGSTFHIYLPISDKRMSARKRQSVFACGTASILLVDDEEQILKVMSLMLTQFGYRIDTEVSPAKALERFRKAPEQFDVVFTDLTMPGMNGIKLAEEIYSCRPDLPVILMTGFAKEMIFKKTEKHKIVRLLKKPIRFDAMITTINEVMASDTRYNNSGLA